MREFIENFLAERRAYILQKLEAKKTCNNCAALIRQLEAERRERSNLIEKLTVAPIVAEDMPQQQQEELKPIQSAASWIQKRHELETASREKANELRKANG